MAVFTQLFLVCGLTRSIPQSVLGTLNRLLGENIPRGSNDLLDDNDSDSYSDEPFDGLLKPRSAGFVGDGVAILRFDEYDGFYHLTLRTSLRGDVGGHKRFLEWLTPYIVTDGFLGYLQSEVDIDPTLIYFKGGQIVLASVSLDDLSITL